MLTASPNFYAKQTGQNGAHRCTLLYLLVIITKPSNYAMIYVSFDDIHKSKRNQALNMVV